MTAEQHRTALWLEVIGAAVKPPGSRLTPAGLINLLRSLDPIDARVVVLHAMHGMKMADIGERINCTKARVYVRWHRAIARLKKSEEFLT